MRQFLTLLMVVSISVAADEKSGHGNYFNPFSRKRMSVIPKSENDCEVRELLGIIDAACGGQK